MNCNANLVGKKKKKISYKGIVQYTEDAIAQSKIIN